MPSPQQLQGPAAAAARRRQRQRNRRRPRNIDDLLAVDIDPINFQGDFDDNQFYQLDETTFAGLPDL